LLRSISTLVGGSRAVERGGREWSANLPKICLGPPQNPPSKKDKGVGILLLQCRGKKKRWLAKCRGDD
jgi:hypothetical protein